METEEEEMGMQSFPPASCETETDVASVNNHTAAAAAAAAAAATVAPIEQLAVYMLRQEKTVDSIARHHGDLLQQISRKVDEHFAFIELRLSELQLRLPLPSPAPSPLLVKPPSKLNGPSAVITPPEVPCPQLPSVIHADSSPAEDNQVTLDPCYITTSQENGHPQQLLLGAGDAAACGSAQVSESGRSHTARARSEQMHEARSTASRRRFRKTEDKIKAFDDVDESRRKHALQVGVSFRGGGSQPDPEEEEDEGRLARCVQSARFDLVCAIVVALNAIFMGVAVEELYSEGDISVLSEVMENFFLIFYLIEISLRAWVAGWRTFLFGKDAGWNITDTFIVIVSIVYRLLQGTSRSFTVVRILRNLRMVRILRVVRVTRFFKQLRMLIYAIASTLKTCMWTISLLCVFVYMFAIAIGQLVAYHMVELKEDGLEIDADLYRYFNNLAECIFTLFMSVSGGIDWESAVRPLFDVGWPCVTLFVFYIVVVVLCVMNLMTGIFVESAMDAAQSDRDHVITCELEEAQRYKKSLTDLFEKWDVSGDHNLTITEFEKHLADGRVKALFRTLDIDPSDAWTFFKLLDRDKSGMVSLDEFINGCVKLKGGATGFHMERIMYETRWLIDCTTEILTAISELSLVVNGKDLKESITSSLASRRFNPPYSGAGSECDSTNAAAMRAAAADQAEAAIDLSEPLS